MKQYNHAFWLSLCAQATSTELLVSNRLQNIITYIPNPDVQTPSFLVLIGNTAKNITLRELFGIKRAHQFSIRRGPGEVHLHMDPSSIFGKPLLITDTDLLERLAAKISTEYYHKIFR